MTATHTPGPWRQDEPGSLLVIAGEGKSKDDIVAGCWGHSEQRYAEGVANARLISAAPEMLAALKAGLAAYSHSLDGCDCEGDCDEAVALGLQFGELAPVAIAKAEGRTDGR
jgi:hypothetical protein